MKITRIQYTVQPAFAEQNKRNIARVMQELRSLNHPEIRYSSYLFDDGKTFMHFVLLKNEEAEKVIRNLEAFKTFQAELKASNPEKPPQFENLALVDSSFELF